MGYTKLVQGSGRDARPVDVTEGEYSEAELSRRLDSQAEAFYEACQAPDNSKDSPGVNRVKSPKSSASSADPIK